MTRFFVFGYYEYEAMGGFKDLIGSSETSDQAMDIYKKCNQKYDVYEIWDIETMEIVFNTHKA